MNADPLDSVTLDVATGVIDHLDTMYPAALQAVPSSARISLRNTIRAKVRQVILADRESRVEAARPLPLTRQQHKALEFIKGYIEREGLSPSYEEIATGLGLQAKSGACRLLHGLQERNRVRFTPNRSRSIEVLG